MSARTLLIFGGSGAMGRHVIKHVLGLPDNSWRIRVFTRDPMSAECRKLKALSPNRVDFFKGNVDDSGSLRSSIEGVYGIFCNTNYWSCFQHLWAGSANEDRSDPWPIYRRAEDTEVQQGQQILEFAKQAGVHHFLYSSLDAMALPSNGLFPTPHFDAKARVEEFIDQKRQKDAWYQKHTTVLVTAPYMENFKSSRMFRGGGERAPIHLERNAKCRLIIRVPIGSAEWPMVTLDDIGWFAAHIFSNSEGWNGRTLKIASDALPMKDIAKIFTKVTGIESIYEPYSLSEYRQIRLPESDAIANMFGFYEAFGTPRDFTLIRSIHKGLSTFECWLRNSNWRGGYESVQKELATTP